MRLIIVTMCASLLVACATSPLLDETRTFIIQEGATAQQRDLTITFVRIVADSRCPANVQCVWEGNAEVELRIAGKSATAAVMKLNTNSRFAREAAYLGYLVRLVELAPCPAAETRSCIQLRVIRSQSD